MLTFIHFISSSSIAVVVPEVLVLMLVVLVFAILVLVIAVLVVFAWMLFPFFAYFTECLSEIGFKVHPVDEFRCRPAREISF